MTPIAPGVRLGPYEILAPIGAGGMGEVFRAKDTRLDRTVAIKVLAQDRSHHPELRKRFDQEARTIASLSHPHICHLNDVGHQDGIDFLVMEHLQGETLADRLTRSGRSGPSPLGIDEVVRYGIEIAEALSEAHRHGIVHRDLKPTNVFLARTGGPSSVPSVKLLDFGLAKLRAMPVSLANSQSTLAPEDQSLTEEGAILGTWRYMAPEQLEGKEADARTDIFAFGVVLYEMATGKKPFDGESHASVIAAVLDSEPPPISALQPAAPPALVRIITKCLAKNADARWQSARDLADALKWIGDEDPARVSPPASTQRSRSTVWRWATPIAVAAAAIGVTLLLLPRREVAMQPVRRFSIVPPAELGFGSSKVAFSPDGRYLAYRGQGAQGSQIYLHALDELTPRPLAGTIGGFSPVFSPDSQWVAFRTNDKVRKASLSGDAVTLFDQQIDHVAPGMTWLPDGTIVAGEKSVGLIRVSAQGGTPASLTTADPNQREIDHHSPSWLPGGHSILVTVHKGAEAFDIAIQRLDGPERRVVVQDGFDARYVSTGHLVFFRGGTMFAVAFDAKRLEVTGKEVPVLENVGFSRENGEAGYAISDEGSLAYTPIVPIAGRRLMWIDRNGVTTPLPVGPRAYSEPSLSPNGRRLAVQIAEGSQRDIWVYDFDADALTRVTFNGVSQAPVWTPDGSRLTFSSTTNGRRQIYWMPIGRPGEPELLVSDEHSVWPGSWSPDQTLLAFMREPPTNLDDIGIFRLSDRKSQLVVASEMPEEFPRISPDGRWLAYSSFDGDRDQVYIVDVSGIGGKRQVSPEGGNRPVWSRDGRELFYRAGSRFMRVPVASGSTTGKPLELPISRRIAGTGLGHPGYDVAADGRLLVVEAAETETGPRQIQVVLNWVAELKARVSSK